MIRLMRDDQIAKKNQATHEYGKTSFFQAAPPLFKSEPPQDKISIPLDLRRLGLYIAGNPGTGKSSAIQNFVIADIKDGFGVAVIDPGHDLVEDILRHIPKERLRDVIYFDTNNPIPLDFFSYEDPNDRTTLIDQFTENFKLDNAPFARPRMKKVLGTLLEANEHMPEDSEDRCTFLDLEYFLLNKKRRDAILFYCSDFRKEQWSEDNFPKNPSKEYESLLERMGDYTEPGPVRAIFAAKRPRVRISDIVDNNKILLVKLKETKTDWFIGSLIVTKFQQYIFTRLEKERENRKPFFLYIDECNTVIDEIDPKVFKALLLRARKLNLNITLANQIPSDFGKLATAIGTIQNLLLFNLQPKEAHSFKDLIAPYEPQYLIDVPEFRALLRTGKRVVPIKTPRFLGYSSASYAKSVKRQMPEIYAPLPTRQYPKEIDKEVDTQKSTQLTDDRDKELEANKNSLSIPAHHEKTQGSQSSGRVLLPTNKRRRQTRYAGRPKPKPAPRH